MKLVWYQISFMKFLRLVWQKEWDEVGLVSNKFHEILPKVSDKLLFLRLFFFVFFFFSFFFTQGKKTLF